MDLCKLAFLGVEKIYSICPDIRNFNDLETQSSPEVNPEVDRLPYDPTWFQETIYREVVQGDLVTVSSLDSLRFHNIFFLIYHLDLLFLRPVQRSTCAVGVNRGHEDR
jgi:hypothetical protein